MHFKFLSFASIHLGLSMVRAHRCVHSFVRALDSDPPIASTAPTIASLSPVGISAHEIVVLENIRLGSGVCGLVGAALFLRSDSVIHDGLTTLIILFRASGYCGKSLVVDRI